MVMLSLYFYYKMKHRMAESEFSLFLSFNPPILHHTLVFHYDVEAVSLTVSKRLLCNDIITSLVAFAFVYLCGDPSCAHLRMEECAEMYVQISGAKFSGFFLPLQAGQSCSR